MPISVSPDSTIATVPDASDETVPESDLLAESTPEVVSDLDSDAASVEAGEDSSALDEVAPPECDDPSDCAHLAPGDCQVAACERGVCKLGVAPNGTSCETRSCMSGEACANGTCAGGGPTISCSGRECGKDSCGASCGTCSSGETCAGGTCAPICDESSKRVFMTSAEFDGRLMSVTASGDGHELCEEAAASAGLGGSWRAWLTTDTTNAFDAIVDVGPWYLVGACELVFSKRLDIVAKGPATPIDKNEFGVTVDEYPIAWTGTDPSGHATPTHNCSWWTYGGMFYPDNSSAFGMIGYSYSQEPGGWTESYEFFQHCSSRYRIICIEQ